MLKKKLQLNQNNYDQTNRVYDIDGIAPTITTPTGGGHMPKIEVKPCIRVEHHNTADVHFIPNVIPYADGRKNRSTIKSGRVPEIGNEHSSIRRLTQTECERLQGFPDSYTKKGIDNNGNDVSISDTQRYKVLGNAVTVNVVKAIGERLLCQNAEPQKINS